tara:strand:+ start:1236 stop:2624 length:1389 start_codon:yes stop_codon:yes gene_type:complete
MKKIISFSVWGSDLKYTMGALKNADLAKEIYPDWICRYYLAADVPRGIVFKLEEKENVEIVEKRTLGDWTFSFNRFLPMSEEGVDAVIFRDADSRLTVREKAAVDQWLASDKGFHIMKDHPWHYTYPILAGMFGCKGGVINNISKEIDLFEKSNWYHSDQEFLKQVIYPKIKNNVFIHDDWNNNPFPIKRDVYDFVGQVFDENDNTVQEHLVPLINKLSEKEVYIHHHLGLGDHIDCNAMVRSYLKPQYGLDRVCLFAKDNYYDLIKYMYRDDPRIVVLKVDKNSEHEDVINFIKENKINPGRFLRVGHENYPWGKEKELGMGCAEIFYKLVGIDYSKRFDDFYFLRDEKEEQRVFEKLNPENCEYVFVHDDPSRGFSIPDDKIYDMCGEKIKIIKNDMSENLFHFCKILENAKQIHCMESCFRSLVETLDTKGEFFFHNFRDGASGYLGNSTQKPWEEIKW